MTKQEASERYNIPIWLLDEYESWGLCQEVKKVMGSWQYDDSDLERLSMIMTLHDVGFTRSEIETYMHLLRERVCQDDFCKFSKFKYLSAEKSPNISCLHIS